MMDLVAGARNRRCRQLSTPLRRSMAEAMPPDALKGEVEPISDLSEAAARLIDRPLAVDPVPGNSNIPPIVYQTQLTFCGGLISVLVELSLPQQTVPFFQMRQSFKALVSRQDLNLS